MVKRILPIVVLVFVWLIFSKPFFINGKIPYPSDFQVNHYSLWNSYEEFLGPVKNPSMPDVVDQLMPWRRFTIDSWKDLTVPLWNPYSFSGTPHLANYQSAVFSITNLLFFIFSFNNAWGVAVLIQPLLCGLFMYLFIKSLKLSVPAALISSVSFMFCGFIVVWMSWSTLSLALSFLPLSLFAVEEFFKTKRNRYLIILFISIPLSFFSGHFQTSLYVLIIILFYSIFKFYETKQKKETIKTLFFILLGILFSMPQILPSIELYLNAPRSSIFQKVEAVPFSHLATLIAPDFYGNPVTRNNFLGNYIEWNGFFGVIPLLLALFALMLRTKKAVFFIAVFLISMILSLDSPIADLLVKLQIPVLSTSSLGRILGIFSFSGAVLAAFGFDLLVEKLKNKNYKDIFIWIALISFIFLLLWLVVIGKIINPDFYHIALRNLILPTAFFVGAITLITVFRFNKKLIPLIIVFLVLATCFDMLRFAKKWQPFESKEIVYEKTPIINELEKLDRNFRTFGPYGGEGSVYYKIPSLDGYDPLYVGRYGEFISSLNSGSIYPPPRLGVKVTSDVKFLPKVIDFLGIKYVLQKESDIDKPWQFPFDSFTNNKFNKFYEDEKFFIYENTQVFPKALLVGNYQVIKDNNKIISTILSEDFDFRKSVVLEKDPQIIANENISGSAEIINYSPNRVSFNVVSNSDGLLVLNDNFFPGWIAKVNDKETETLRANYTFRSVAVPKGESRVIFYYDPKSFKYGMILAFISIFAIILFLLKSSILKVDGK